MTGPSTTDSDDPLTLALDARWLDANRVRDVGFRIALAVALAGHLFFGVVLTGGLDGVLGSVLGPGREAHRAFGDEKGEIDGVAAEVIDAAEFNKRYVSFKAGKAEAEAEAQPQKPAEKPEPQSESKPEPKPPEPKPPEEQTAAEKPADGWEQAQPTPVEQPKPREEKSPQKKSVSEEKLREDEKTQEQRPAQRPVFSEAEMQQLVTQSVEDLQSALVSVSTPGAARLGEASPFVRSVVRTLKINMPKPPSMKGRVVLRLFVGTSGEIEAIRIVGSSGQPELDRFVAERVAKTRLAPPPATASPRERTFQISYEYN